MRLLLVLCLLLCSACTDSDKAEIHALLDTRDQSISQRNIALYKSLLEPDYLNQTGLDKIAQMEGIFTRFEAVQMVSRDRDVRIVNDQNAICEQTYVLKVLADKEWREIVQCEQLTFKYVNHAWKINGGL